MSDCTPLFSEVARRTTAKLGEGVRLRQGKTKFECVGDAMSGRVIQGQMGSNPYSLSYGGETWLMERCSDVDNFEGQFKVIRGHRGQIRIVCHMEVKLGG